MDGHAHAMRHLAHDLVCDRRHARGRRPLDPAILRRHMPAIAAALDAGLGGDGSAGERVASLATAAFDEIVADARASRSEMGEFAVARMLVAAQAQHEISLASRGLQAV